MTETSYSSSSDQVSEHFEQIREIIADTTNTDPAEIWPEAYLLEDLNITEDAIKAIVRRINKTFTIVLNLQEIIEEFETVTVQNLLNYVEEEIELG
jgi:acyl carrier protein